MTVDVSCFVGDGPLVPAGYGGAAAVADALRREGVVRAAVSPLAGLFTSDPTLNDELADLPSFFRPVPVVDPRWPDLAALLATYRDRGSRAVRISPGSHGYRATGAVELARTCAALGLTLVLQLRVADPRNLPAGVDLEPVAVDDALALANSAARPVSADLSLAEQPDVLARAVAAHGAGRLLVGTHTPFLTPAAARQKLAAARLTAADDDAVRWRNATALGF